MNATRLPSGEYEILVTHSSNSSIPSGSICDNRLLSSTFNFQSLNVLSFPPEAKPLFSGDHPKAGALSLCAFNFTKEIPWLTFQIRMVESLEGDAIYFPSGDHTILPMAPSCPLNILRNVTPGMGDSPTRTPSAGPGS